MVSLGQLGLCRETLSQKQEGDRHTKAPSWAVQAGSSVSIKIMNANVDMCSRLHPRKIHTHPNFESRVLTYWASESLCVLLQANTARPTGISRAPAPGPGHNILDLL